MPAGKARGLNTEAELVGFWEERAGEWVSLIRLLEEVDADELQGKSREELRRFFKSYLKDCSLVLDAGCGEGRVSRLLLEEGHEVVCLDLSITMLREGVRKAICEAHYVCADADMPPFRHGAFDTVVVFYLLDAVPNPLTTLLALREVLREDGLLLVAVLPLLSSFREVTYLRFLGLLPNNGLVPQEVPPLLEAAGFKLLRVEPLKYDLVASKPIPQELCRDMLDPPKVFALCSPPAFIARKSCARPRVFKPEKIFA